MNSTVLYSLLAIAILVIVALAVVAWRMQSQVWAQQRERKRLEREQATKAEERKAFVLESLRIISANVLDEDLNLSEATIRCKILVDALDLPQVERQTYQALDTVFERVQHFDTHQARKELSRDERARQDAEREAIEAEHEEALKACFGRLRSIGLDH